MFVFPPCSRYDLLSSLDPLYSSSTLISATPQTLRLFFHFLSHSLVSLSLDSTSQESFLACKLRLQNHQLTERDCGHENITRLGSSDLKSGSEVTDEQFALLGAHVYLAAQ